MKRTFDNFYENMKFKRFKDSTFYLGKSGNDYYFKVSLNDSIIEGKEKVDKNLNLDIKSNFKLINNKSIFRGDMIFLRNLIFKYSKREILIKNTF
jgi:hypothetical protein